MTRLGWQAVFACGADMAGQGGSGATVANADGLPTRSLATAALLSDAVPGDSSTTVTITPAQIIHGTIDSAGDHDWIRLELPLESASYRFETLAIGNPGLLADTTLTLRDENGVVFSFDDDGGDAPYLSWVDSYDHPRGTPWTGIVYVDIGGSCDARTGDYYLSLTPVNDGNGYSQKPLWSNDQIAGFIAGGEGLDGGVPRHFDVVAGGTLTVGFLGLSAESTAMVRAALGLWTDVTGIGFVEVSEGAQIQFMEFDSGGFVTRDIHSGGITSQATISLDRTWYDPTLYSYAGTTPGSYPFTAAIHEIGHALGLGHSGPYNGGLPSYLSQATYGNDSYATSVMSYFSQTENGYTSARGFAYSHPVTPMAADILAATALYGEWAGTRTGDTIYGFNSSAERDVFDAALLGDTVTYTIIDHGGIDTIDYSGFTPVAGGVQTIVLKSEAFSLPGYGSEGGQVTIARGSVIENAIGGAGVDIISGNDADNKLWGRSEADQLYGLDGNDTLRGGAGVDTLVGGAGNDKYVIADAGDVVIELVGGGTDRVRSSVTHKLAANVENLLLAGTGAVNGTGNGLANILTGNGAANVLSGGGANDTLSGWDGSDTLNGGGGSDTLNGGTGMDTFRFTAALGTGNIDTIGDYAVSDDTIQIGNAAFTGLVAGALTAGAFYTGTAAHDANDRIIYNSAAGALLFDADGNGAGAAIQFATIGTGLAMTAGEFRVI